MDYEQKFLLFKKLIDKTFSSYEKKYSVNFSNKTYQVEFTVKGHNLIFTIFPCSKWSDFKKIINDKLKNLLLDEPYCNICFVKGFNQFIYCDRCTFVFCNYCFDRIRINNGNVLCPQCRYNPLEGSENELENLRGNENTTLTAFLDVGTNCIIMA